MVKHLYSRDQTKLCDLLRSVRENIPLTQAELARILGRHQSYVSKYESGERRLDILELRDVCRAVRVPLTEFVKRLEESIGGTESHVS